MKHRIVAALAVAILLVAGIASAFSYSRAPTLVRSQPMDEVEFDLTPKPGEIAGFNSTKVGTEIAY